MATTTPETIYSGPAAADYSAVTYPRFVVRNGSGQIALAGLGARAIGILENQPEALDPARYAWGGSRRIQYGGDVAINDPLTPDATGKAIKATVTGQQVMGRANIAGALNDVGNVQWSPEGALP